MKYLITGGCGFIGNNLASEGNSFNIGGGIENSLSLLELFKVLEKILSIKMDYTQLPPRDSDQLVFVANNSKINRLIDWQPKIDTQVGLKRMVDWLSFE